jgi:thioredoxin 1
MVRIVEDKDFSAKVIESEGLILVDFWAEWCGPCRMLLPTLEEVSNESGSSVKIFKMNIDENPQTPTSYGVRSIPTMMLFKNGELLSTKVGALPKSSIINWLNEHA